MLYVFFWVIPRRLNFICRRFGTHCLFHIPRQVGNYLFIYLPMKMEETECSETSAYNIQTPGNYPEENIQHTEHDESLKSGKINSVTCVSCWGFYIRIAGINHRQYSNLLKIVKSHPLKQHILASQYSVVFRLYYKIIQRKLTYFVIQKSSKC